MFLDTNSNGKQDASEMNYTGNFFVTSSGGQDVTKPSGSGQFFFFKVFPGTNTITSVAPYGYAFTTPASYAVTVGSPCSVGKSTDAYCSDGSVEKLNFGLRSSIQPWFQSKGSDLRVDALSGFIDPLPSSSMYVSTSGIGGMPGIIFSGKLSPNLGIGKANQFNWQVGNPQYPDVFTSSHGLVPSSYDFLLDSVNGSNLPKKRIADLCSGSADSCNLNPGLANGIYWIDLGGTGNLNLVGSGTTPSYTFPAGTSTASKNFVILVNGNLNINEKILVPNTSTVIFSAKGNITVGNNIGEPAAAECNITTHANCTIEGLYSADGNFYTAPSTNSACTGITDRLNVAGTVIANAGRIGGSFINNRTLCGNNSTYPSVSFVERPDFILNYPSMTKQTTRAWKDL